MKKVIELKKLWIIMFLFVGCIYGNEINLGVVDYQLITERSKEGKKISETINSLLREIKEKLKIHENNLSKVYKKISDSQNKKNEEKKTKVLELQQKSLTLRKKNEELKAELNSFIGKLRNAWRAKFEKVIKVVAKEKGLMVIVSRDSCVYRDESVDVSNTVISKLNDNYKEQEIKIPTSINKLIEGI